MKNTFIITPYYPFPINENLKQDTKVVYYLIEEKKSNQNIVILYYYQHLKMDSLKNIKKLRNTNNFKEILSRDDRNNDVLLFEHSNFIPRKVETIEYFDNMYLNLLNKYLKESNIEIDTLVVHFPVLFSNFARKIKAKNKIAVVHSFDVKNPKNINILKKYISIYSKVGFRSQIIKDKFNQEIETKTMDSFLCLSGVPDNYLKKDYSDKIWKSKGLLKLIYVGRLDSNKNVSQTIKVLGKLKKVINFEFNIIGEGHEMNKLKDLVIEKDLTEKVHFLGYLSRNDVFKYLVNSDVFVMTSKKETLGISYLEAIAAGNIVIGTKNQGIDGLFTNEEGCFFVNPNDDFDLEKIILNINNFSISDVTKLRVKAYNKIITLSEREVSRKYIDQIFNI